jgi:hypothetical protein
MTHMAIGGLLLEFSLLGVAGDEAREKAGDSAGNFQRLQMPHAEDHRPTF